MVSSNVYTVIFSPQKNLLQLRSLSAMKNYSRESLQLFQKLFWKTT